VTDAVPDVHRECESCGSLDWTITAFGRVMHAHDCPYRVDAYCQTHPRGCPTATRRRLPISEGLAPVIILVAAITAVLAAAGWSVAQHVGSPPVAAGDTFTRTMTGVRTVTQATKGRVITLPGGTKVVHVAAVVIHADGKRIIVPAHNIKIHRVARLDGLLSATVALPVVPVTVTAYVPTTSYSTSTVTVTETSPPVTVTVTLPLTAP
jgi:hypothetical protein